MTLAPLGAILIINYRGMLAFLSFRGACAAGIGNMAAQTMR